MSYKGLVMAGYQGWFNAPGDGAGRGWNHYKKDNLFEPGHCSIDLWPDVKEYPVNIEQHLFMQTVIRLMFSVHSMKAQQTFILSG